MKGPKSPATQSPSRREFLANGVLSVGAALGLGSLAYRFIEYLYPVVPPLKFVEVAAGTVNQIPRDGVRFLNLPQGPVMLEKRGDQVHALSAVCTHLGCTIRWHSDRKAFVCPCHGGVYGRDGQVVSGPPPRPLDKLGVTLRDGRVFVHMIALKEEQV